MVALIFIKPSASKSISASHDQVKIANRRKLDPFQSAVRPKTATPALMICRTTICRDQFLQCGRFGHRGQR
jgi:hypothetical protein